MAHVTVSKEARRDLIHIRSYIQDELNNPSAADHIILALRSAIEGLQTFPNRGRPLDALLSIHTEYRYIPCENYCIFYIVSEEDVFVIRILHQRQDSLKALFLE